MKLNKKATAIVCRLIEGLDADNTHRRIGEIGEAFEPVSVEIIELTQLGLVYSISQFFIQEGDVMWDPMMSFLVSADKQTIIPIMFEQSLPPVYTVAAKIEGMNIKFSPKAQQDITLFACEWLSNVNDQHKF